MHEVLTGLLTSELYQQPSHETKSKFCTLPSHMCSLFCENDIYDTYVTYMYDTYDI